MSPPSSKTDDAFVNVQWINGDDKVSEEGFYESWLKQASAKHEHPAAMGAEILRKRYPDHSLVLTSDFQLNLHAFPGAVVIPADDTPLITNLFYVSLGTRSPLPGILMEAVEVGGFNVVWEGFEFLLFTVQFPTIYGYNITQNFILHEGPETNIRTLLLSVGSWASKLHGQIWVFDQGFWRKDSSLWYEIQKAEWKDVILKDEFKTSLQKDVYGFFDSEILYKDLGIPWKRGLIMHGPPGNGKTVSLKVVMKTCDAKGYAPLYVKSFKSYFFDFDEEYCMTAVFNKARELAPCVLVFEDLDSLITDDNRSFFLNQLDGLEGNDGLLIIGTTNHFDRLDPGLSSRPSRFDRKYLFDDPDRDERVLYAQYWQRKLKGKNVEYPDSLVGEIADASPKFSFAYLKEAFVSALVTLAGMEDDDKPSFRTVILDQIAKLKKQLDNLPSTNQHILGRPPPALSSQANIGPVGGGRNYRHALQSMTHNSEFRPDTRLFTNIPPTGSSTEMPGQNPILHRQQEAERRFRQLFGHMSLRNEPTDQRYLY